ncbi:A-Kinase Anchor Protein 3 [Manis pentadactyla]|nr:A-Kinase Anchor Protein 3 [Manis pentadactyla]
MERAFGVEDLEKGAPWRNSGNGRLAMESSYRAVHPVVKGTSRRGLMASPLRGRYRAASIVVWHHPSKELGPRKSSWEDTAQPGCPGI